MGKSVVMSVMCAVRTSVCVWTCVYVSPDVHVIKVNCERQLVFFVVDIRACMLAIILELYWGYTYVSM